MLEQAKNTSPKKVEKKVRVKAKTEDSPSKESDQKKTRFLEWKNYWEEFGRH